MFNFTFQFLCFTSGTVPYRLGYKTTPLRTAFSRTTEDKTRTRLKHCKRSQKAEMLLDRSAEGYILSNDYTKPHDTCPDPNRPLRRFCAPLFCDFVRNYSCTIECLHYSHFDKTNICRLVSSIAIPWVFSQ